MKIQNTTNGGFAEVDDELGNKLIATGTWELPKTPAKKAAPKTAPKES